MEIWQKMNEKEMKESPESKTGEYRPENRKEKMDATGELVADKDFEFMKEKIKERPINKKRLLRRTVLTALMAVIFGLIACFTFLVLEPVFSNMLYPEEEPKQVAFPEVEDEMLPKDMLQTEDQLAEEEAPPKREAEEMPTEESALNQYQTLNNQLYEVAKECQKSMVTVTGVTSDVDWFNNPYESRGQTSGLILADNGKELLILANKDTVENAETIQVTFVDGEQATGTLRAADTTTGIAIICVPLDSLGDDTKDAIVMAVLGSSNGGNLLGSAIVAVGNPMGSSNSVVYGILTSVGNVLNVTDNSYRLLTTDIYGSSNAGGVLADTSGKILGIITMQYNQEDAPNMVSAIGISELKKTIQKLSNGQKIAYLGIHAIDVTTEANLRNKVPFGAYVTEIEMDSPAMNSGIQSGDVVVKIGNESIENMAQYVDVFMNYQPENEISLTVMRYGKEEYQEMEIKVKLGNQ